MLKDTFTFQGPLGEIECVVEPNRSENNAVLVMAHGFRGSRDSGGRAAGVAQQAAAYVAVVRFNFTGTQIISRQVEELRAVLDDTWVLWWGVSNSIPMKDREDYPFRLEIYTEERFPAATFCLGSDGLLYAGKLRFRPLNADLLAALEPLAEQWEQEHKNGGDG